MIKKKNFPSTIQKPAPQGYYIFMGGKAILIKRVNGFKKEKLSLPDSGMQFAIPKEV